jgi:hypothetical protein
LTARAGPFRRRASADRLGSGLPRLPRLHPATAGGGVGLMTRRAANRAPRVVGSQARGGGCSCADRVGTASGRFTVEGGEEIVLRQRGGMGPPDRGIADMKVGREPSSLQRVTLKGSKSLRRRPLSTTTERSAPADLVEDARERARAKNHGRGPSRPRPLGGGARARETQSTLNQYSCQ